LQERREREPFARKGTICKKRAQYVVEEQRNGGRGREREPFAGKGSQFQEVQREGTIFKEKEPCSKKEEGAVCSGKNCREREWIIW
jgi:hypothetical protein